MRTLSLALLVCVIGTIPLRAQDAQVIDRIVAVVGDRIVLKSEVDALTGQVAQQQQIPSNAELWTTTLNEIIDTNVLTIHAERDTTIEITNDQIEQQLDQRLAAMTAQVGSEEMVEAALGKSIPEIRLDLQDDIRDQMLAETMRQRKLANLRVTPTEVRQWFKQFEGEELPMIPELVRVAHIVRFPEITEEAKADANEVLTAIRDRVIAKEATFEDMAEAFSEDPGSATNGGRYADRPLSQYTPNFAAVASQMANVPGAISQIFETEFGLHILRVNEVRGEIYDLNHILVGYDFSKADPTAAIEYLNTVRDSILTQDMPFELMAKRHSEEQQSAPIGGRVTDPRSGERDLVVEALGLKWKTALDQVEVGDISEPSEVDLLNERVGYHIILLQRRVAEHAWNLETDYERLEQYALQEKQFNALREWLQILRKDVYIDIRYTPET
ncbi:MAG: peptidylprolyl isomerase [Bacteroidota bacterium]